MAVVIPFTGSPAGFFIRSPGSLGEPSPLLADNIDPETGDYASMVTGMDVIDAQVVVATTILRGSGPSVMEDGILITPQVIDESVEDEITGNVRTALSRLITNGDIQLVGVEFGEAGEGVDPGNQTVNAHVKFINLRAMDDEVRKIPLSFNPSEGR